MADEARIAKLSDRDTNAASFSNNPGNDSVRLSSPDPHVVDPPSDRTLMPPPIAVSDVFLVIDGAVVVAVVVVVPIEVAPLSGPC